MMMSDVRTVYASLEAGMSQVREPGTYGLRRVRRNAYPME